MSALEKNKASKGQLKYEGQGSAPGEMTLEPGLEGAVGTVGDESSRPAESKGQGVCPGRSGTSKEAAAAGAI